MRDSRYCFGCLTKDPEIKREIAHKGSDIPTGFLIFFLSYGEKP